MDEHRESNRELWNAWTDLHVGSGTYDVEGFKAGKSSLHSLELGEVGDVQGKSLLHLQCHFGLDTLSWARLGATVTGADFSEHAIGYARQLSQATGIDATFICTDLYALPDVLEGEFDIVYTSYGTIYWLPDLQRWAKLIDRFLKPGGLFYIAEFHPFSQMFESIETAPGERELKPTYPYFYSEEPLRFETKGSYASPDSDFEGVEYGWSHPLSEVLSALAGVGLRIEFLHEFPFSVDGSFFPELERGEDGYYRLPSQNPQLPLLYSIRARKEG